MTRRKAEHPKHASLRTRKPIPRTNPKRKAANFERSYGAKAEWTRGQRCCVPTCLFIGVAAHTANGGASRKGGSETLVPLCPTSWFGEGHHEESHRGVKSFEKKYGVGLKALAAEYERRWLTHLEEATP